MKKNVLTSKFKRAGYCQVQWYTSIILATQETRAGQLSKTQFQNKIKRVGAIAQWHHVPEFDSSYHPILTKGQGKCLKDSLFNPFLIHILHVEKNLTCEDLWRFS